MFDNLKEKVMNHKKEIITSLVSVGVGAVITFTALAIMGRPKEEDVEECCTFDEPELLEEGEAIEEE